MSTKANNLSDFILILCYKEMNGTCSICLHEQKLPGPSALKLHAAGTWKTAYLVQFTQVPSNWMGVTFTCYLCWPLMILSLLGFVAKTLHHELVISSLKGQVAGTNVTLLICNFFMQVCWWSTQFCRFPSKLRSMLSKLRLKPPFQCKPADPDFSKRLLSLITQP